MCSRRNTCIRLRRVTNVTLQWRHSDVTASIESLIENFEALVHAASVCPSHLPTETERRIWGFSSCSTEHDTVKGLFRRAALSKSSLGAAWPSLVWWLCRTLLTYFFLNRKSGTSKATAGPGKVFSRAPRKRIFFNFLFKTTHSGVFYIFEQRRGPPNVAGPGVTYSIITLAFRRACWKFTWERGSANFYRILPNRV